jgi:acyl carrier protein
MASPEYNDIFQQVEALLEEYAPQRVPVRDDTELVNDLGFDSLRIMEMLHEIEDAFDITYPLNDLSEVRTVKDFVMQIQNIVGQK